MVIMLGTFLFNIAGVVFKGADLVALNPRELYRPSLVMKSLA